MVPRPRDSNGSFERRSGRSALSRRSVLLLATGVVGATAGCQGPSDVGAADAPAEPFDCSGGDTTSRWPMGQFDAQNTGSVAARGIPDDATATTVHLDSRVVAAPVFAGGDVVAATRDGVLHVVSPDGVVRERHDLRAGTADVPPVVGCGGLFCQTGRSLTVLSELTSATAGSSPAASSPAGSSTDASSSAASSPARSSPPAWTADLGSAGATPQLNLHDGTLLAVTPGALVAVDAATGDVRWRRSNDRGYWEGAAVDDAVYAVRGEPTGDGSDSAVTYDRASVHALDSNGDTLWTRDDLDETQTGPVVDGDRVYVATTGGTALALRKASGEVAWTHDLARGRHVFAPPAVDDDRVYVHDGEGGDLVALRKRDGEKQWAVGTTSTEVAPVVVGTDVYAVDVQSGPPIARIDADEGSVSRTWSVAPTSGFAVGDGVLAFGTSTGLALVG